MALTMKASIVGVQPTKSGSYSRVVLASGRRVNDLLMVPAGHPILATAKPGAILEAEVRAAVETNSDGRPTRNITYWLADQGGGE